MFKGHYITLGALVLTSILVVFVMTTNNLKLQDISMSTKEREACYSMIQQFALDGLEKYLYTDFKAEGVALIEPGKEGEVISYVESNMMNWDVIKTDVENLTITGAHVFPGTYSQCVQSGAGSEVGLKATQTEDQLPRYEATLEGDVKRLLYSVGDSPTFHFKIKIDVIARHLDRDSGYIDPSTFRA